MEDEKLDDDWNKVLEHRGETEVRRNWMELGVRTERIAIASDKKPD